MDKGAFIMHRCHGSTTDINRTATRACTKMKATITQRFTVPYNSTTPGDSCDVDAESDCRFCFFWEKIPTDSEEYPELAGEWRARFVRHWYEKDKMIPVNPAKVPVLDEGRLAGYPSGYRYLAYLQEETMGVKVLLDMPGHRREGGSACGLKHDLLYWQAKQWVEGEDVEV